MAQPASDHNPFMLMINPEVILAAVAKSERLGQLNRQLCRPLDRVAPGATPASADDDSAAEDGTSDAADR